MKKQIIIGDIIQVISGLVVAFGIGVEFKYQAHYGLIFITVGGFLWGLSVKIKGR